MQTELKSKKEKRKYGDDITQKNTTDMTQQLNKEMIYQNDVKNKKKKVARK